MNATCTCNVEDKWHNYNLLLTYIHTTALKQRYMYAHLTHNLCRVVVSVWVTRKQLTELPLFSSKHFELKYKTLGNVDILFEIEVLQAKSPIFRDIVYYRLIKIPVTISENHDKI